VLPALLVVYGLAPTLVWSAVSFAAVGAGYIAVLSGLNTVVQLRAPAAFRGRVLSIYMMALGIVYPLGAVLQGLVADRVGVRGVTVASAVLLAAILAGMAVVRPGLFADLGDPAPAAVPPVGTAVGRTALGTTVGDTP
jgi:predicted MFS family arabinose efflux permease